MAKYTMQLRTICEVEAGLSESVGNNDIDTVIEQSMDKIFDNFPIFDENYRAVLMKKIIKHYYTREIGFETVGLFKLKLSTKMGEIMPYYNKLYESELLEFNPLYDVDITTERDIEGAKNEDRNKENSITENTDENNAKIENVNYNENTVLSGSETHSKNDSEATTSNTKTTTKDDTWDLYSDTPQGALSDVKNGRYLTNAENTEKTENSVGTADGTRITNGEDEITKNDTTNKSKSGGIATTEDNDVEKTRNEAEKSTGSITNIEDYFEHVKGKKGTTTYSKMLKEFRETFLNIDMMIIDELKNLFFLLW